MPTLTAPVNGSSFRPPEARDALYAAKSGMKIELVADPRNKFDPLAIEVHLCGHHVGFIAAHSKNGLHRHKDFHSNKEYWGTAVLKKNDAGEARVQIEVPS